MMEIQGLKCSICQNNIVIQATDVRSRSNYYGLFGWGMYYPLNMDHASKSRNNFF